MALTRTAVDHRPLLERLSTGPAPDSIDALAREMGRDPSNLRKTLKALEAERLIERAGAERVDGGAISLTPDGARALQGLDVADGAAGLDPSAVMVRHEQLRPNPLNPRDDLDDDDEIDGMAESIAAAGIRQPLSIFPADDEGVHIIDAGHRRWRAVDRLIASGRWALDKPLPCRITDAPPSMAPMLALIENGQRRDLTWTQEARAYRALLDATGWSAREAARKTGRDPRTVQDMVRVLAEADPADIEAFEAGDEDWTVERLRKSVARPDPDRHPRESEAEARSSQGGDAGPHTTKKWPFSEDIYAEARALVITDRKASTSYVQRRLQLGYNTAAALMERMEAEGVVSSANHAGAREVLAPANAPKRAVDLANPAFTELTPQETVALLELAHKTAHHPVLPRGGDKPGAHVFDYWLGNAATGLIQKHGFVMVTPSRDGPAVAVLTDAGKHWLWKAYQVTPARADTFPSFGVDPLNAPVIHGRRLFVLGAPYHTPWLNASSPPVTPAEAERSETRSRDPEDRSPDEEDGQPSDDAGDADDEDEDPAEADPIAARTLNMARETTAYFNETLARTSGLPGTAEIMRVRRTIADMLDRLAADSDDITARAVKPPFDALTGESAGVVVDAGGLAVLVCDQDGDLSHPRAQALAAIVALALNLCAAR